MEDVIKYFSAADAKSKYNIKLTPAQILYLQDQIAEQNLEISTESISYIKTCQDYNRENYKLSQNAAVQFEHMMDEKEAYKLESLEHLRAKDDRIAELMSQIESIEQELILKEAYSIKEDRSKTQNKFLIMFLRFASLGLLLVMGTYIYLGTDVMASILGSYIGAFLSLGGTAAAFMFGGNNSSNNNETNPSKKNET